MPKTRIPKKQKKLLKTHKVKTLKPKLPNRKILTDRSQSLKL